jgi:ribokinase
VTARGPVAVLGAINVDLVVSGADLPRQGETVIGGTFAQHHGGKGGNQAVAAARSLGRQVAMIGAVGDDALGAAARDVLAGDDVDVSRVRIAARIPTGVALIAVDERGENQISVAPGANAAIGDVTADLDVLRPSIVLASCEVPLTALRRAAAWCARRGVTFVLNPAPASPDLAELLDAARVLTPNRGEVRVLGGGGLEPIASARAVASGHPGQVVVVTLGSDGAAIVDPTRDERVPAPAVDVVDATGAGDCFNGVLVAGLWEGRSLEEAVRRAVVAATLSTRVPGARDGMPTAAELDAALA